MTNYFRNNNLSIFERPLSVNKAIDLLIFLYISSIYILSYSSVLNFISKLLALALMGVLAIYMIMNNKIHSCKMFVYFGLFFLFCIVSCLWAIDFTMAFSKVVTLFQIFVLTFLLYNYLQREKKIEFFIKVMCIAGTVFSVYTVLYFGVEEYFAGLESGERLGGEINNVNAIGMITSIATLLNFWYIFYKKKYFYVIFAAVCGIVTFGSGSRTAIVGFVAGVIMLFLLRGDSRKKIISLLQCFLILVIIYFILQLSAFEALNDRIESMFNGLFGQGGVDNSAQVRMNMIEAGWEQFLKTPLSGVGIGNSDYVTYASVGRFTYLHNNYVELLASVGIIGTIFYYLMFVVPITKLIKPALKKDSYAILALILIFVNLVYHYGTVDYYNKIPYLYLIIIWLYLYKDGGKINEKTFSDN